MSSRRGSGVVLVAFAALSAGCGGKEAAPPPFAKDDSVVAGGAPLLGTSPDGLTMRFVEQGRLGIGIVLHNRADRPVTVLDVRTLEPPRSLVQQVGTRLVPWNPPPCKGRCPFLTFFLSSYDAVKPDPVEVGPNGGLGVQLNYVVGSCSGLPFGAAESADAIDIHYRVGNGPVRRQSLPLGSARLRPRPPAPADCSRRPHSRISIEGPFATSSAWAIPASSTDSCVRAKSRALQCRESDVCVHTAPGGLRFRSGLYASPSKPAVSVSIELPRFHGLGLYRSLRRPASALGPAIVRVTVGIGDRGWTTFRSESAVVVVTSSAETSTAGRFRAVIVGPHKEPFRVNGIWRCTAHPV